MAMHPRARQQRLEMVIGILAVFALMAIVNAVAAVARGAALRQPILVLLGFAVLLAYAVHLRRAS